MASIHEPLGSVVTANYIELYLLFNELRSSYGNAVFIEYGQNDISCKRSEERIPHLRA